MDKRPIQSPLLSNSLTSSVPTENPEDERHMKGCGILPGCPGPTGFHNNHTFHFLRCCNTTKCNAGPGEGAGDPAQDLGLRAERCIQAGCSQANPSTLLSPLGKKMDLSSPFSRKILWEFKETIKASPRPVLYASPSS